jgi:hypothetical protein
MWPRALLCLLVNSKRVAAWLERLAAFAGNRLAIVAQGIRDNKLLEDDIIVAVAILPQS